MSDWKRCLLSSALVAVVACGDDELELESDGGNVVTGAADGGKVMSADAGLSGGRLDGGRRDSGGGGSNTGAGDGGEEECGNLMATIRDFKSDGSQADFQTYEGNGAKMLLKDTLGSDGKPVFNNSGSPVHITSAASFHDWYNDTAGVNINIPYSIPLTQSASSASMYEFSSNAFFPIDNKGFATPPAVDAMRMASDGKLHNFSFTTEVHTSFTYHGGENFSFMGDDDLWIFVNSKLALDLGGVHGSQNGSIDFDAMATQLGITKGTTYRMDIFHAERHTVDSNFTVRTNIDCFKPVIAI